MRKLGLTLFCVFLLTGCGNSEVGTVEEYFPIKSDVYYEYVITGLPNGDSTRTIYNHYINENRVQRYINSPATTGSSAEVIEVDKNEVTLIYGDPIYYFYENITDAEALTNQVLLKGPIKQGQKWESNGVQNEITNVSMPIETPSGTYDCIEVSAELPDGRSEKYYYAKDVGLVQSIHSSATGELTVSLSSLKEDQVVIVPAYFYYTNTTTGLIEQTKSEMVMKTNEYFFVQLETIMKTPPSEEYAPTLPEDAKINSITVDRLKSSANIDFANNFADSSLGDGVQASMIKCIVDTVGNFYDVANVSLSIDGGEFVVGDIAIPQGEFVAVTESKDYLKYEQDQSQPQE